MSDDDDKRIEQQLRGTIPFEDIDLILDDTYVVGAHLLEEVADGRDVEERTDPFRPAVHVPTATDESTRQHAVPAELLWKAMHPEEGWLNTYAIVGRNGVIRLGAGVYEQLEPGERVEIRIRRLKRSK